jgi:hypothetical protein
MSAIKIPVLIALALMLSACIGPKVEVPPPHPDAAKVGVPSLTPPDHMGRRNPLTPKERHRVEDSLSQQAATPAPLPQR